MLSLDIVVQDCEKEKKKVHKILRMFKVGEKICYHFLSDYIKERYFLALVTENISDLKQFVLD